MRKTLLLLLIALSITTSARAADDLALEAMAALRRGFAGTTDFTAEITQEKQLSLMKRKMVSKGVVRFKKPDTFFIELFPPQASRLLLRDNLMIIRLSEQGVTDRVALSPEEGLKKWFAYLAMPVNTLPEGMDARAERNGKLWDMHLFPKSKGLVKQLTLSFDSEGNISRIVIDERNRDRTVLVFSNMRRNVGIRDGDFRTQ